jgi:hypothetical protein
LRNNYLSILCLLTWREKCNQEKVKNGFVMLKRFCLLIRCLDGTRGERKDAEKCN